MLLGVRVLCGVLCCLVCCLLFGLNISFSRLYTSVGKKRAGFSAIITRNGVFFLFEGVYFSSGCLGKAVSFYCGSPWASYNYFTVILSLPLIKEE